MDLFDSFELLIFGGVYFIFQAAVAVCSTIYMCKDLKENEICDEPSHIRFAKIVSTIGIILMAIVFVGFALKFYDNSLFKSGFKAIPLTKYFYLTFISFCICRFVAIPKYMTLFCANKFKEGKIKSIKETGNICPDCGTKADSEKQQRYLVHPRTNIVGHRIYTLQFFALTIICSMLPWIRIGMIPFSAYGCIRYAINAGDSTLYCIGIIYMVFQIAVIICSFTYLCMDICFKNKPNKPFYVVFAKWYTTIIVSLLGAILLVIGVYVADTSLATSSSVQVPFTKYFYYTLLLLFSCRCLIIPEYIDGYYQNKRMDMLDRKNNKWMFE